jgi:hypothetical protein
VRERLNFLWLPAASDVFGISINTKLIIMDDSVSDSLRQLSEE